METINLDRQELNIVGSLIDLALDLSEGDDIRASLTRVQSFIKLTCSPDKPQPAEASENTEPAGVLSKNDATIIRYAINVYEMIRRGRYENLKEKYGIDIMDDLDKKWMKRAEEMIPDELYGAGYMKRLSKSLKGTKVPARKLYIADLHFFHDGLCRRMDHRPFKDHYEMNPELIRIWNENVTKKDEVYLLGDFSIAKGKSTNEVLEQLARSTSL